MANRKINTFIGGFILVGWLSLYPIYLLTNESLFLAVQILLVIFLAPFFWGFITTLLGEKRLDSIKNILESTFNAILKGFAVLSIAGLYLIGAGIFLFQIYSYLKKGEWLSISVIDGIKEFGSTWAANPTDWQGIWNIFNSFPLSLSIIVIAYISTLVYQDKNAI